MFKMKRREENNMLRELNTVQTQEKLNRVFAVDEKGNGGANHQYFVTNQSGDLIAIIGFQNGARHTENAVTGVLDCDLLEIAKDRLTAFQEGAFASEYNAQALEHIEKALYWLNKRVEDRIARNVLGKNNK